MQKDWRLNIGSDFATQRTAAIPVGGPCKLSFGHTISQSQRLGAISQGGWELQLPCNFLLSPRKERMGICWRLLSALCICPHSHSAALANEWEKSGQSVICSQLASCCPAPGMEEADKWPCVLFLCKARKFKRLRETEGIFLLPFAMDIAYLMLEYSESM